MRRSGLALVLIVASGACQDPESPGPETEVRDSLGVRIVTSVPTDLPPIEIGDPELIIGGRDEPGHQLYRIRAGHLLRDGGVILLDGSSNEIRRFSPSGDLVATIGGTGDGPGEFRTLSRMQVMGLDSIVAFGTTHRRATVFDLDGTVLRTFSADLPLQDPDDLPDLLFPPSPLAVSIHGLIIGIPPPQIVFSGEPGLLPVEGPLTVFSRELEPIRPIETLRLVTYWETPESGGAPIAWVEGSPMLALAHNGTRLALSEGWEHEILVIDDGALALRVREHRQRLVYRPDSVDADLPVADSIPAYSDLAIGSEGRIWARAGRRDDDPRATWRVFSADGVYEGDLSIGSSDEVLDSSGDRLLLLRRDELEVETVEVVRYGSAR